MDNFWDKYEHELNAGYFKIVGQKKCLKEQFIVEYPQKIANELECEKTDKRTNKKKTINTVSQIWKFYDHARRIQDSLRLNGETLDTLQAELCVLRPVANYALSRETVTDGFRKFIDFNVMRIKDRDDLDAFIKHFQSLIAYFPKENQK